MQFILKVGAMSQHLLGLGKFQKVSNRSGLLLGVVKKVLKHAISLQEYHNSNV